MRLIKEYLLIDNYASQTVYLPDRAKVVDVIKDSLGVKLIVIAPDCKKDTQPRTFKICDTEEKFYAHAVKYIGYFIDADGQNRFVIEDVPEVTLQ